MGSFANTYLKDKTTNSFASSIDKNSEPKKTGNSFGDAFGISRKVIKDPIAQIIQETPKDKSILDRVKEVGSNFTAGLPSFLGTIKAGIGNYIDSMGKGAANGEMGIGGVTSVADKIDLYEKTKKELETALKENKNYAFADGQTVPGNVSFFGINLLKKVDLSEKDRADYKAQLIEVNSKLSQLKVEDAKTTTISEQLKLSAKEDFKKSEEERQKIVKQFGESKKWSGQWLANEVAANTPQFLASFGVGLATMAVTKNPQAALAAGFSSSYIQESGAAYQEAISTPGVSEAQAQKVANNIGIMNAVIEQLPLGRILSKIPEGDTVKKSLLKEITSSLVSKAKQGVLEGSTESMQEIVSNAWGKTYDKNRKLLDNVLESGVVGGVLGVGGDLVSDFTPTNIDSKVPVIDPKATENAKEILQKALETPEAERTSVQNDIVDAYVEARASDIANTENTNQTAQNTAKTGTATTGTRKFIKVEGLPETVTGKSVVIRPDGTASYNLEIDENSRGKGIGARAVKTIENAIVENGATRIELPVKEESIGFFEKQGYTQVGEVKNGLGTMTKDLNVDVYTALNIEQSIRDNVANIQQDFIDGKIDAETRKSLAEEQFSRSVADKVLQPIEEKVTTKSIEENITNNEKEIKKVYSENKDSVNQALSEIYAEMDVAEAGFRVYKDGEVSGIGSTFPKWIPEHLRNKKLFNKVMEGLVNIEDIHYPEGNRPKQRELYNEILDNVDSSAGIDTSSIRNDIIKLYENAKTEKQNSKTTTAKTDSSTRRGIQPTDTNKEVIRVPKRQLPVGEGKEKISRLQARIRGVLDSATVADAEELGLATFRQMNQDSNIAAAAEFVANNPEGALRVITGEMDPPNGVLTNSVLIALKLAGSEDTELGLKVASLTASRGGQELAILRKLQPDNPVTLMEDVVKTRIEAFEKRTGKKITDKVKQEVKKINAELKAPSARQWDSFLASIRC